jgi:hypothetical protein
MENWVHFSNKKIVEVQSRINNYRKDFFRRSSGIQLPNTICVGGLEKSTNNESNTDFFVSMPVKNQEKIIKDVLHDLISSIDKDFELGLLFDNCVDNSFEECRDFFLKSFNKFQYLQAVYFIESDGELFESSAENILFSLCMQKYFVSVQSDIYFTDVSFLHRSELAFSLVPELFAISGKAIVSFKVLTKSQELINSLLHSFNLIRKLIPKVNRKVRLGYFFPKLGYFGDVSSPPNVLMKFNRKDFNTLYLGEAIIRGPVIWRAEIFRELNGYDDVAHPLGRDDCDICFRAFLSGYLSGYLPCGAYSVFNQGTTRKQRSPDDQEALDARNLLARSMPGRLVEYWNGELDLSLINELNRKKNRFKINYGKSLFLANNF